MERIPGVRYLKEPRLGLGVARNAGIRHATGEIIAFTDDDVGVHPTWVERLQQGFVCPEVLAITGLILPASLGTHAQWIFEKEVGGFSQGYRSILFGPEFLRLGRRKGVPVWRIGLRGMWDGGVGGVNPDCESGVTINKAVGSLRLG